MLPRSLNGRLLATFVTLMLVGLGSVIGLSGWQLTSQDLQHRERDLELQARTMANGLRGLLTPGTDRTDRTGGRSIDTLLAAYAQGIGGRVTLLDPQLTVTLSSDSSVAVGTVESQAEVQAGRAGRSEPVIRRDEFSHDERVYVAVPIAERGQTLGYLQVSVPAEPIYAELRQTWLTFLLIGGVVLLLTVGASVYVARQIAVPVQNLTATSEQIAAGHLDKRVSPAGPSEVRRLGMAFNAMAGRVQEMIEQQRAFVDNAAHELRSPLTSMRLRIEMLQTRGKSDPELTQHYLAQMDREASYLQRLVEDLLSLASVEHSQAVVRKTPLDLAACLRDTTEDMRDLARHAGIELETRLPETLAPIQANADQMSVLIRNLIDNAIKYTPAGGTITVSAETTQTGVDVRVADTGVGIPPEALDHVFDRFYRVDKARSRAQGGVGLGLSLVRAIAEAHGGTVEAQSRVGVGSTFTLHLPLTTADQRYRRPYSVSAEKT